MLDSLAPIGFLHDKSAFTAHTIQLPNVNGVEEEEKEGGGWGEVVFASPKVVGVEKKKEEDKKSI